MLLQRLQHWAFERGSLIILFERHRTPFLNYCQQAWQLKTERSSHYVNVK